MLSDKQQKKKFKAEAANDPDKYYPTAALKDLGFSRKKCTCGTNFWTQDDKQELCGDPGCQKKFTFFENNPAEFMSYTQVWQKFASMFDELGYTPIARYPSVARWNPTMDFTIASIAAFQPYVVSGEVEPPANPLVIPQFSVRFGDIDNVGITGSHMTGFVMIGQHMFVKPELWNQDKVFRDLVKWFTDGIKLPLQEITIHEDAWAGGGNFGPCIEFFSRGIEIANQVYMMFEQTPQGPRELDIKVLDMGMGMERVAWFTQKTPTIYDATFPTVIKKLKEITNVKVNEEIIKKFIPYAGQLNIDEVEDINKTWDEVATKVGVSVEELRTTILPMAALYSIAEHTRTLLVTLSDGALPSNTGGGYNLRILIRRALGFIDKYKWNINLPDVCEWHADFLSPIFPELSEHLDEIRDVLDIEMERYNTTRDKTAQIVSNLIKQDKEINTETLLELYDSQGIAPELIKEEAEKVDKQIEIPDNFYALVSERHEKKEQTHQTKRDVGFKFEEIEPTAALYYEDYRITEFLAKVIFQKGKYVVLDKTYFYPTSGGQLHDTGKLGGIKVTDVFKEGSVIVHVLDKEEPFEIGQEVRGEIDHERRVQLAQNHTAAHILNAAAKEVLGSHINQAGAKKTPSKAHLDITHYTSLTTEEVKKIEKLANEIVDAGIQTKMSFMPRTVAEQKYGMEIYQGGAVPGKQLRIVEIPGVDVECCGGTHLRNTAETGRIKILKSSKISDGIVRLTYVAGKAAQKEEVGESEILSQASELLGVEIDELPSRAEDLFTKWKKGKKLFSKKKAGKEISEEDLQNLVLEEPERFEGNILVELCKILKTQPEHVVKTLKRFSDELDRFVQELNQ